MDSEPAWAAPFKKTVAEARGSESAFNPLTASSCALIVGQVGNLRPIVNRPFCRRCRRESGGSQPPRRMASCPTSRTEPNGRIPCSRGYLPSHDREGVVAASNCERGSALLIVLVFAAIVAIMLYKALPDAYFEAQRQKEQLLIDRANEYKTAIKRFYTKNKTYPTSLEQLDNLNNVRYLRRHYKDPMTGKNEWRLIHMGPGFVLTDSKVTPLNSNATTGPNGATTPNGNNQGGFGSTPSTFGSSNSTSNSGGFGNSGAFGQSSSSVSNQNQQDGTDPNAPSQPSAAQLYGARRRPSATSSTTMEGQQSDDSSGQPSVDRPLPEPGTPDAQQTQNGAPGQSGTGLAGNGAQQSNPASAAPGTDPNNPAAPALNAVNNSLRQQQPNPTPAFGSSSNTGPTISNGAIAGVASTAKGSSIKVIDKQTDYSKWEFVFNPQKDAANQIQSVAGNNNPNGQNPNGQNQGNNTGFGSPGFSNSPGGFSTSPGGFGSNNNSTSNSTNTNSSSYGNH
jgi:hypothetical protein